VSASDPDHPFLHIKIKPRRRRLRLIDRGMLRRRRHDAELDPRVSPDAIDRRRLVTAAIRDVVVVAATTYTTTNSGSTSPGDFEASGRLCRAGVGVKGCVDLVGRASRDACARHVTARDGHTAAAAAAVLLVAIVTTAFIQGRTVVPRSPATEHRQELPEERPNARQVRDVDCDAGLARVPEHEVVCVNVKEELGFCQDGGDDDEDGHGEDYHEDEFLLCWDGDGEDQRQGDQHHEDVRGDVEDCLDDEVVEVDHAVFCMRVRCGG